ncbi:MAG: hypothetical protein C0606_11595 [Hyphomicrobiales bacterium]|nr:MAG: hypothetical protein C0606_11595 [Hyphomicrobiales bacterium]
MLRSLLILVLAFAVWGNGWMPMLAKATAAPGFGPAALVCADMPGDEAAEDDTLGSTVAVSNADANCCKAFGGTAKRGHSSCHTDLGALTGDAADLARSAHNVGPGYVDLLSSGRATAPPSRPPQAIS